MSKRKIRDSRWGLRAEFKSKLGGNRKKILHPQVRKELGRVDKKEI